MGNDMQRFKILVATVGLLSVSLGADAPKDNKDAIRLDDLQGAWVVDVDKLADTPLFKKNPKELPNFKKKASEETFTFMERKIAIARSGKLVMELTIEKHQSHILNGLAALQIAAEMKRDNETIPDFEVWVLRRDDRGLEIRMPNDLIVRPIKRLAKN